MSKVVVVGSINMDLVVRAPRFALAGETILGDTFYMVPGGKGANQAVAARRTGADVAIIGRVGNDTFGSTMRHTLAQEGINTEYLLTDSEESSGVALISVDAGGENNIIVVPGANGRLTPADIETAQEAISTANMLLMQLEIPLPTVEHAALIAHNSGVQVILNAAPARSVPAHLLAMVDYLVVNETEAALLAPPNVGAASNSTPGISPEELARNLLQTGVRNVVVTLGAAGCLFIPSQGHTILMKAFDVQAVDTTAAGDAFVGAFATMLAAGLDTHAALEWGNAAGALAVTGHGAQPSLPSRAEVEEFLRAQAKNK